MHCKKHCINGNHGLIELSSSSFILPLASLFGQICFPWNESNSVNGPSSLVSFPRYFLVVVGDTPKASAPPLIASVFVTNPAPLDFSNSHLGYLGSTRALTCISTGPAWYATCSLSLAVGSAIDSKLLASFLSLVWMPLAIPALALQG